MTMIRETIVTTINPTGAVHVAPLGVIADGSGWVIAPFRPSTTLENLRTTPFAVVNCTDDVRIFAGCLTGRRDYGLAAIPDFPVPRLAVALSHMRLRISSTLEDAQRPRFHCEVLGIEMHAPFLGFNRAQAAVVEAAILVSRLNFLPRQKIEQEMAYLEIAVSKTSGPAEEEAWQWLKQKIADHFGGQPRAPAR
jgi:uncharacterized protein